MRDTLPVPYLVLSGFVFFACTLGSTGLRPGDQEGSVPHPPISTCSANVFWSLLQDAV